MTSSACKVFFFFLAVDLQEGLYCSTNLGAPHYHCIILISLIKVKQQLTNHIRWITGRPVVETSNIIILLVRLFTLAFFLLLQFITLIGGDKTQPFQKITNQDAT